MKKLISILIVVLVLLVGCEQPYSSGMDRSVTIQTYYPAETPISTPQEANTEMRTLAPIDESLVYIWDEENLKMYLARDLPDGTGTFRPTPFLYTDGSLAQMLDFEFYRPDRSWYFKVLTNEEVIENGVVVGWVEVIRVFKQKDGVVESVADGTPFPAHDPIKITEYEINGLVLFKTLEGWYAFMNPADTINSFISMPMKDIEYIYPVGNTIYMISESPGYDHPQLHMIEGAYRTTRITDYSKVVYKP